MPAPLRPGPQGHLPTPAPVRRFPAPRPPVLRARQPTPRRILLPIHPGPSPTFLSFLGRPHPTCRRNSPVLSVASRRRPSSWSPPALRIIGGDRPSAQQLCRAWVLFLLVPRFLFHHAAGSGVPPCCAASVSSTPGAGKPLSPRPTKRRAQDLPTRRPPQPNKLTAAAALAVKLTQAISRVRAARSPVRRSPPARRLPWLRSPTLQIAL